MSPEEKARAILESARPKIELAVEQLRKSEESVEDLVQFHKPSLEGMEKWLLATLFAINGAAAVAVLNAAPDHFANVRAPLISFTLGVVCAVLAGLMQRDLWDIMVRVRDATRDAREKIEEFTKITDYKKFLAKADNTDIKFEGEKIMAFATLRMWILRIVFYSSLLCFIVGAYLAGTSMQ